MKKSCCIRIDLEIFDTLREIASYEGRSINGQIVFMIQRYIAAYDKQQKK